MAIKFSQFITQTSASSLSHIVGYNGADNIQITPANFFTSFAVGNTGQVSYFDSASSLEGSNEFFWDSSNNKLGIGTSSPNHKIHVVDDSVTTGTGTLLELQSQPINNGGSLNLDFRVSSANTANRYVARISGMREGNGALSQLQFWTESSGLNQRMTITSAGNVGIGTNTPSSTLQISGTLDASGISQLGSGGSNVYLTSSSAGNVGIGTSSPSQKLAVTGNIGLSGSVLFEDNQGINFGNSNARIYGSSSDGIKFNASGSEAMRLNQSGNVGIGTTSPAAKLDVNINDDGTTDLNALILKRTWTNPGTNDRAHGILFSDFNSSMATIYADRTNSATNFNSDLLFATNTGSNGTALSTKMIIKNAGNVGIGTSSPDNKLDVVVSDVNITPNSESSAVFRRNGNNYISILSSSSNFGGILFGEETDANDGALTYDHPNGNMIFETRDAERMRITSTGNVGIGTTSPSAKLEVAGGADTQAVITGTTTAARLDIKTNSHHRFLQTIESDGRFRLFNQTTNSEQFSVASNNNATFAGDVNVQDNLYLQDGPTVRAKIQLNSSDRDNVDIKAVSLGSLMRFYTVDTLALTLDDSQNATFEGTVLIDGVLNYTGLEIKGSGASRPSIQWSNATQGDLGSIFGTEANALVLTSGSGNLTTLTLDSSQNATFAGDVIMSKNAGPTLNMNTNSAGNTSKILLHEGTTASPQNGASIRYDGSTNNFKIGVGTNVDTTRLTIDRGTGLATFANDVSVTGTTFLDGLVTIDHNLNIQNNGVLKIAGTEVISATRAINATSATFAGDVNVTAGKVDITQSSATDPVLRLTDDGVANYDFIFPDASTIKLETNTSSTKTFKLLNAGSGDFNFEASSATFAGNIIMGDNDVTGIDELVWTSGTKLRDNNTNYLQLNYASGGAGGILIVDGDNTTQGYIYADGQATSSFGLLDGSGSWAVKCVEDAEVELRYDNSKKFETTNIGVSVTGDVIVKEAGQQSTFETSGNDLVLSANSGQTNVTPNIIFKSSVSGGAINEKMRISSSGYIYVNTGGAEPGASQVGVRITGTQGQAFWNSANSGTTGYNHFNFYNDNGAVGSIVTNGSATAFNTSSDYRLKEDLQDFNGLDKVSKIPVYDFKWKVDDSRSYGVLAHELQEVVPNAVNGEKDAEEMQGVDYSKVVPLLVKSIQELKAEVEDLKSKI